MNLTVNGEQRRFDFAITLDSLVDNRHGIAIALNGTVVRAADWGHTALSENDVVEIVTARQGG